MTCVSHIPPSYSSSKQLELGQLFAMNPENPEKKHTLSDYCSKELTNLLIDIENLLEAYYWVGINGGNLQQPGLQEVAEKIIERIDFYIDRCGDKTSAKEMEELRRTKDRLEDFLGSKGNEITIDNLLKALSGFLKLGGDALSKLFELLTKLRRVPNP